MDANNMKAMREALVGLVQSVQDFMATKGSNFYPDMAVALEVALEALAAPPRNCDVGTAEEQMKRQHDTMCNTTRACPDSDWACKKCFAEWGQMLYAEGAK